MCKISNLLLGIWIVVEVFRTTYSGRLVLFKHSMVSLIRVFSHKTLVLVQRSMFPPELMARHVKGLTPVPYNVPKNWFKTVEKYPSVMIDPSTKSTYRRSVVWKAPTSPVSGPDPCASTDPWNLFQCRGTGSVLNFRNLLHKDPLWIFFKVGPNRSFIYSNEQNLQFIFINCCLHQVVNPGPLGCKMTYPLCYDTLLLNWSLQMWLIYSLPLFSSFLLLEIKVIPVLTK